MKNLFLIILFLLFLPEFACAQQFRRERPVNTWVGGSFGLTLGSKNADKYSSFDDNINFRIIPELGFMVNHKLGIGINLGFSKREYNPLTFEEVNLDNSGEQYVLGTYARYFVYQGDYGKIFIDGGAYFSRFEKEERNEFNQIDNTYGVSVGFSPGFTIHLSRTFSLIGKVGFLGYGYSETRMTKFHNFGANINLNNCSLGLLFTY